jgi:hypothetical protein
MPSIHVHHVTSHAHRFFGRDAELALLNAAIASNEVSLVAMIGPGGQGKTAILQHWLTPFAVGGQPVDGVFFWSFYRGKDADLCLRELYAQVAGSAPLRDLSATYCVDHLLPLLRQQRWIVALDGVEVVQYDTGPWYGRFAHPELGRLLDELASRPLPGVVVLTTRFPLPELERCPFARTLCLASLDAASARDLLRTLGVRGADEELDRAAEACGFHAKAVELLGTYLAQFCASDVRRHGALPAPLVADGREEEQKVSRVLAAFQQALPREAQDVLALTTAFRDPTTEARVLDYLVSDPVRKLLHATWGRTYLPFQERPSGWLDAQLQELIDLRLVERVRSSAGSETVLDAHPLVRRGFEHVLGGQDRREHARARAGFLHGRPDRRKAASLAEAREEMELFHAYCEAGLWAEADATLAGLDDPRYRFVAPAFERDLLLRFFPQGDWRQLPLWPGFDRYRALAICFEMQGDFASALAVYRQADAPLRGDALIALGRLDPLLADRRPPHPWQMLWQAYRAHALCLAGRTEEAVALAALLVPNDVYEWTHVFECLLRAGRLDTLDMHSFLYRPPHAAEHRWNELARQRMRADYLRITQPKADLSKLYEDLIDAYDRGGLPWERCLTRLGFARWLLARGDLRAAEEINRATLSTTQRHGMRIVEADAWTLHAVLFTQSSRHQEAAHATAAAERLRLQAAYRGASRP